MFADIKKSIFRVISHNDQWVGSGFLYMTEGGNARPVFATCAHVVGDALGDRSLALNDTAPKGSFFVDFPYSDLALKLEARVYQNDPKAWYPMKAVPNEIAPLQDLALINIDKIQYPDGVEAAIITSTNDGKVGETVFAYGGAKANTSYTENFPVLAEGIVQGQAGALLQIRANDPGDKAFIECGFSGGPLWNQNTGAVLGVVALADEEKNLAWVIPTSALCEIFAIGSTDHEKSAEEDTINTLPEIPFDFQPRIRELLLKRSNLELQVDERIDEAFLLYLYGEPNTGKSSEIQRLMESPVAKMTKERTIWQTCINGTVFSEMADYIAEDCLNINQGKKFGVRELIRELKQKEMYLVLDGYSKDEHPTITPLVEFAAHREKPTHIVVTTNDDPDSNDIEQCAVRIPKVHREDVIASIEALGAELTVEYAQLVESEAYDASSAYRIVNLVRNGQPVGRNDADPVGRVDHLYQNDWDGNAQTLMSCLALIETSVQDDFYELLCKRLNLEDSAEHKAALLSESLIRADDPRSFTIRDYCRKSILDKLSEVRVQECHKLLGDAFAERISGKTIHGFMAPNADVLDAIRAIRHYQLSGSNLEKRLDILSKIRTSAARKGMHRLLATTIGFEVEADTIIDPWLLIQFIQSELALGRTQDAFSIAKVAQRAILQKQNESLNLIVSLCTQFASVLSQARENTLAGHLLGVSKNLFPSSQISSGLVPIRDSLKAWCDGKSGKIDNARRVGRRLLEAAREQQGAKRFMQLGIESTRLGVLEGSIGNYREADELLNAGVDNFSRCDRRGEIWALSNQCYFRLAAASTDLPIEELERLLDLQSTTLLISEETFSHFRVFERALQGHSLHSKIISLSESFAPRYERMKLSDYEIEYAEAFIEVLQREFGEKQEDAVNQRTNELLSDSKFELTAQSGASYAKEAIGDNPKEVLRSLYEDIPPEQLLNSLFYARILTNSLLELGDDDLISTFVETHFDDLMKSRRLARLNYSGFFERCGRPDLALKLLGTLRGEKSFRYHNISANCYKHSDFDRALFHNEQALLKAVSPEEKSRMHNNLAALYLLHGRHDKLPVIKENLRRAISLRASHFFWPFRTELAAKLTSAMDSEFDAIISEYTMSQKLSDRAIKYVASLQADPRKKMLFLDLASKYVT